jgi:glycosyltransferase involved in cell wall biosynthesis
VTATHPWVWTAIQALFAARSWDNYRRWPRLPEVPATEPLPTVSVIVPARDEAENLMRLLPSLLCLEPGPTEILVVDDRSRDRTAAIASGFGVRVLASTEPPAGWSGKNWACQLGSRAARGEWLLFTDADTWHAPESLGLALKSAIADRADLLSVLTGQECRSLWERLLLPFAYSHYFAAGGPTWANDDRARSALANGQYLLVRRAAYDRVGGHAAVRGSLGEDVDFARLLRRAGGRVRVYRAERLVRVRMYSSLAEIQTGFRKYMAGYLRAHPPHGAIVAASTIAAGLPLARILGAIHGRGSARHALAAYVVGVLAYLPWVRWFGISPVYALLQPLAYAAFQAVALDAGLRSLLGIRVTWKGRRYIA